MKKHDWNVVVDTTAFVCLLLITSTGLLLRYVYPRGGGGGHAVWNMTRHDWVEIHFWLCIVFLAAMLLHIMLHWRWVENGLVGIKKPHARLRIAVALVLLVVLIGLALAPFLSPKQETQGSGGYRGGRGSGHGRHGTPP
ncbi:MAG: DUF4405 domain-containing protein [Kiritimatiellales bacterium]|nr:DUF4405 domain-containing protein [Kiritimatiellales bacterium]